MTNNEELLFAQTAEGAAFRENGLRNLEVALLAKQDWQSDLERDQTLAQYSDLAAQLRAADVSLSVRFFQQNSPEELETLRREYARELIVQELTNRCLTATKDELDALVSLVLQAQDEEESR